MCTFTEEGPAILPFERGREDSTNVDTSEEVKFAHFPHDINVHYYGIESGGFWSPWVHPCIVHSAAKFVENM